MDKSYKVSKIFAIAVLLFHKNEINCGNEANKCCKMIPLQGFALEKDNSEYSEYYQRYGFLDNLKLHQTEWTAVLVETDTVGRNHKAVFSQGYKP